MTAFGHVDTAVRSAINSAIAEIKAVARSEAQRAASEVKQSDAVITAAERTKLGYVTVTQAVDLDSIETLVNNLDQAVVLRGTWDASSGSFPGSGSAQAGDSYIVSTGGTVDSVSFAADDRIVAITDNASTSTFASNWHKLDYSDLVLSVNGNTGAVTTPTKYSTSIGNGSDTTIDVSHNMGTRDIVWKMYEASGTYLDTSPSTAAVIDANTLRLTFGAAPSSGQYQVVVIG